MGHLNSRVSIYFPTIFKLWSFCMVLKNRNLEIDTGQNLLITMCSDKELENAVSHFGGLLVDYNEKDFIYIKEMA